jgi:hypothetical protein
LIKVLGWIVCFQQEAQGWGRELGATEDLHWQKLDAGQRRDLRIGLLNNKPIDCNVIPGNNPESFDTQEDLIQADDRIFSDQAKIDMIERRAIASQDCRFALMPVVHQ